MFEISKDDCRPGIKSVVMFKIRSKADTLAKMRELNLEPTELIEAYYCNPFNGKKQLYLGMVGKDYQAFVDKNFPSKPFKSVFVLPYPESDESIF